MAIMAVGVWASLWAASWANAYERAHRAFGQHDPSVGVIVFIISLLAFMAAAWFVNTLAGQLEPGARLLTNKKVSMLVALAAALGVTGILAVVGYQVFMAWYDIPPELARPGQGWYVLKAAGIVSIGGFVALVIGKGVELGAEAKIKAMEAEIKKAKEAAIKKK